MTIGEVFGEGDEIVCVAHLHKQWAKTCNALSESRLATVDRQRALAGEVVRDDIVKQATKEHFTKSMKVKPTKFNSWKAPLGIGGAKPRWIEKYAETSNLKTATLLKTASNKTMSETSKGASKTASSGKSQTSSSNKSSSSVGSGGNGRALAARN